jgi:hypothetical protein
MCGAAPRVQSSDRFSDSFGDRMRDLDDLSSPALVVDPQEELRARLGGSLYGPADAEYAAAAAVFNCDAR